MSNELAGILKGYLSVKDEALRHLLNNTVELCKSKRGVSDAIARLDAILEDYSSGLEFLEQVPLCSLFLGYAQYKWGALPEAVKSASDAIHGFKHQNDVRNHAIALWMRALMYRESRHIDAARQDITDGIELIERELGDSQRTSHYQECKDCGTIHSQMTEFRDGLKKGFAERAPKPSAATPSSSAKHSSSPGEAGSYVSFPVYTVHAGLNGETVYESAPRGEVILENVTIGGMAHRIQSLRAQPEVVLRPAIFRWLQVQGDSMENAHPVSILEGDCVLVIDVGSGDYIPRYGDIVVAVRRGLSGSQDAVVIKRFTPDGLCSESRTHYEAIPLKNVFLRGLAIAVAKPVK